VRNVTERHTNTADTSKKNITYALLHNVPEEVILRNLEKKHLYTEEEAKRLVATVKEVIRIVRSVVKFRKTTPVGSQALRNKVKEDKFGGLDLCQRRLDELGSFSTTLAESNTIYNKRL
jgi:hypothetical protein